MSHRQRIRVAVIGAGHLGKIHARLLREHPRVEVVAVVDPQSIARQQIEQQLDLPTCDNYQQLIGKIDAAVIATPTCQHFEIADHLLQHRIHLLIEKPLTDSVSAAQALTETAARFNCQVQVGHCERFNPALQPALDHVGQPKFIIANRLSGFAFRSTDIGVVHDLMIHDIDLVNSIFPGNLQEARAVGMSMLTPHEDLAHARLQFSCGGIAILAASRCSYQPERSMQIYGSQGFAAIDFTHSKLTTVTVPQSLLDKEYDLLKIGPDQQAFIRDNFFTEVLTKTEVDIPRINAIAEEHHDWLNAIDLGSSPTVTAEQGWQAVDIAQAVLDSLANHRWQSAQPATTGPHPQLSLFKGNGKMTSPHMRVA